MMRDMTLLLAICCVLCGCSRPPRSEEYFRAHLDEARRVVAQCRAGRIHGEECGNADYIVRLAEAEAMRDGLDLEQ